MHVWHLNVLDLIYNSQYGFLLLIIEVFFNELIDEEFLNEIHVPFDRPLLIVDFLHACSLIDLFHFCNQWLFLFHIIIYKELVEHGR